MLPLAGHWGTPSVGLETSLTIWLKLVVRPRLDDPETAVPDRFRASFREGVSCPAAEDSGREFQSPENRFPHRPLAEGTLLLELIAELSLLCRFLNKFSDARLSFPPAVAWSKLSLLDPACRAAK